MQSGLEDYWDYVEQGRLDDLARERATLEERFCEYTWSDQGKKIGTEEGATLWSARDWEVNLGGILAEGYLPGDRGWPG